MNPKVTMQHIANYVGVSKFSVSKALSGQPGVSDETRKKVTDAAVELGYRLNPPQPSKKPKKGYVCVVVPGLQDQEDGSVFWGQILEGISHSLKQYNHGMIVVSGHDPKDLSQVLNLKELTGIIGAGNLTTPLSLEITKSGLPLVLVDYEDPLVHCDTVFMNNYDSLYKLTNHLIELGHESLQFVGSKNFSESFHSRWLGFKTSLEEHNLKLQQEQSFITLHENNLEKRTKIIAKTLKKMMSRKDVPTALVCANDAIALSAINALQELGLKIPEDCSVTGFDYIDNLIQSPVKLTTVNVERELLGRRAVESLRRRLEHPSDPVEKLLIAGELVIRESTAPVKPTLP